MKTHSKNVILNMNHVYLLKKMNHVYLLKKMNHVNSALRAIVNNLF